MPSKEMSEKPSSSTLGESSISGGQSFCPANLSEYLNGYYQYLFPHSLFFQWLSYGNAEKNYFERREFSFTLSGDIYLRYNSFDSLQEMRKSISTRMPHKIDIGAVYNTKPKDSKKIGLHSFQPVERELVFDIDLTDYDDVRTCCSGADICNQCWRFMVVAARILERFLREDFGFKNLLWVYSGRRGIHCWVGDSRARRLLGDGRDSIANFINIFDGGQFKAKKVEFDGFRGMHPSIVKSVHIIDDHFEELMVNRQDFLRTKEQIETIANLCLDHELRQEIKLDLAKLKTTQERWKKLIALSRMFYTNNARFHRHRYFLEELKLQMCYPRLDINVTRGLNHLLKVPFSVHPKTGRVCVPIDFNKIDQFDPFSVPTVLQLCNELDHLNKNQIEELASIDGGSGRAMAWNSSMSESLLVFKAFIQNLEKTLKTSDEKSRPADEALTF